MQMKKLIMPFCLLSMAAMLYGCGSSSKTGGTLSSVANVSEASCAQCHSGRLESLTGNDIYADYYASIHSLKNVGCQGCHGGGAQHNGVGPLPYADPSLGGCIQCHTSDASLAKVATSKHGAGELETAQTCNRCHTHEGAVQAMNSGFTGDKATLAANLALAPGALTEENARNIKCDTCHTSHKPDVLRTVTGWSPSTVVGAVTPTANIQYNLCTSCHTYINAAGLLVATASGGITTRAYQHDNAWYRIIASTHYDNPATTAIEGYVLRTDSTNPCFDCHNHEAKTNTGNLASAVNSSGTRVYTLNTAVESTIYTDWAQSKHGGNLLTYKYAAQDAYPKKADGTYDRSVGMTNAVMASGVTATNDAWFTHGGDAAGSGCIRCHTSSGAASYLSNPATYDATTVSFSHRAAGQKEMLYCWACHSDAGKGTLRAPGAITASYTNSVTYTYPNLSGSNICISCHAGRATGDSIKASTDADGTLSFINSHYLTAGGTLFGTTGYEYTGLDYQNPSYFKHDTIGSTSAAGTGTNGPCVGCHMTTPNAHKFSNVTKNSSGTITAISSTACATCHTGGYALTAQKLVDEEHEYMESLEVAKAVLASKGMYFYNAHPYYYTATYVVGGSNTAFTNWAAVYDFARWKDTMGAAFNINLLIHDPGGYAHNRIYAKRLIWDAIDFVYNGLLDNDVTAAIDAQVTAARITVAEADAAKAYLGAARP